MEFNKFVLYRIYNITVLHTQESYIVITSKRKDSIKNTLKKKLNAPDISFKLLEELLLREKEEALLHLHNCVNKYGKTKIILNGLI